MTKFEHIIFPSRYIPVWLAGCFLVVGVFGVGVNGFLLWGSGHVWGNLFFQMYCLLNIFSFLFNKVFFIAGCGAFVENDVGIQFFRMVAFISFLVLYGVAFFV
ncbi:MULTISPECIES: hypothetical protein [unclassified Pseudomonas]|uniref:hypothetical protein n=1 Tax=unclassified Pseudomonas TaxID=196821 RepID=UPI0011128D78|nr:MULTISPECIES: hypothetical protein [unclassified Pseudomonas]